MKKKSTFVCSIISSILYGICLCANLFNIFLFKALSNAKDPIGPGEYALIQDTTEYYVTLLNVCRIFSLIIIVGLIFSILSVFISKNIENYKKYLWLPIVNVVMLLLFPTFNILILCLYGYLIFTFLVTISFIAIAIIDIVDLVNNKKHLRKYYYEKSIKNQELIVDLLNNEMQNTNEFDNLISAINDKKSKIEKYNKLLENNLITKEDYEALVNNIKKEDQNR